MEETTYYCCTMCKGLFPERDELQSHLPLCDGSTASSSAEYFSIPKKVVLKFQLHQGIESIESIKQGRRHHKGTSSSSANNYSTRNSHRIKTQKKVNYQEATTDSILSNLFIDEQENKPKTCADPSNTFDDIHNETEEKINGILNYNNETLEKSLGANDPDWSLIGEEDNAENDDIHSDFDHSDPEHEIKSDCEGKYTKLKCAKTKSDDSLTDGNPVAKKRKKTLGVKEWKEKRAELEIKYAIHLKEAKPLDPNSKIKPRSRPTNDKYVYHCPYCEWTTPRVGFFERHVETRHSNTGIMKCEFCEFTCTDAVPFRKHKLKHIRPHCCFTCGQCFSTKKDLQRHEWKHTGSTPFSCEKCDYKTRFKEQLAIHKRRHTGEKLLCDHKGCTFSTIHPSALQNHKDARHSVTRDIKCDQCSYTTNNLASLNLHKKHHTGKKNYECSICGYRGYTKSGVVKHTRIHTKEHVYFCDKCDFSTSHASSMKCHIMSHSDIKPYECSGCGYRSIQEKKVERHQVSRMSCEGKEIIKHMMESQLSISRYRRSNTNAKCLVNIYDPKLPDLLINGADEYIVNPDCKDDKLTISPTENFMFASHPAKLEAKEENVMVMNNLVLSHSDNHILVQNTPHTHQDVIVLSSDVVAQETIIETAPYNESNSLR